MEERSEGRRRVSTGSEDSEGEVHLHLSEPGPPATVTCSDEAQPEGGRSRGLRVPDGGWGWMVAVGSFVVNMLVYSLMPCFGILFSGFLLERGSSSTTIAWVYNTFLVLLFVTVFFSRPLCQEFGQRAVGFLGGFLTSLSMITSALSPSTQFLYFSFSFLAGVGSGLLVGITYTVVAPYFDKRRGLANTVMMAGTPAGYVILAPLNQFLLDEYSFKGAAMIYGAILMNIFVGVLFFHPLKWHMKRLHKVTCEASENDSQPTALQEEARYSGASAVSQYSGRSLEPPSPRTYRASIRVAVATKHNFPRPYSEIKSSVTEMSSNIPLDFCFPENSIQSGRGINGNESLTVAEKLRGVAVRVGRSIVSDLSILRSLRALIICVSLLLTETTYQNFVMMLTFVARAEEHSLQDAARCLSLLGACNFASRLVVSPLSDWNKFNLRLSLMLGYLLKATAVIVLSLLPQLYSFVVASVLFGVGVGTSICLHTLVIIKFMGMENMFATNGLTGLSIALGFLLFGPTIGMIRDATDSYAVSLHVMAAMELASVFLWALMPAAQARDATRSRQQQMED